MMPDETPGAPLQTASSRALVPVGNDPMLGAPALAPRPQAAFLTQLVACERGFQPYRRHRRTEPERAAACYHGAPNGPAMPLRFERRF